MTSIDQKHELKFNKLLITSALPYVNNVPHLGNIIGSVLSADVFARFKRKFNNGEEILFVAGVDEYGTATEMKAREMGKTCKELCDENSLLHKKIYDWFLISPDCYGRTSQPNGDPSKVDTTWPQTLITHKIFKDMCKNGYVTEQDELVMYCPDTKEFVADRYVIGTCPHCKFDKANGDQCDNCGKLLSPNEIIDPRYKPSPELKLEAKTTQNLYIDTDKVWNDFEMTEWVTSRYPTWTKTAIKITNEWLKMGLKPRSITRDLKWGTAVPNTDEFNDKYCSKVFYVWFDAPIGYISITENAIGKDESERYWTDPLTKLVQFMAKDNVQFHSVIFPATLRASGYANIKNLDIASTEYLMYENDKFSKTRGTGLFCDDVVEISKKYDLPADYWRAYLIFIRPENSDSSFVLNDEGGFVDFVNNILIKNFGNLVHRVASIAYQVNQKHKITEINISKASTHNTTENSFLENAKLDLITLVNEYKNFIEAYKLSDGLKTVLKVSTRLNVLVNDIAPWSLIKQSAKQEELYAIMAGLYELINQLADIFEPYMPTISQKVKNDFKLIYNFGLDSHKKIMTTIVFPTEKPNVIIKPLCKIDYVKL